MFIPRSEFEEIEKKLTKAQCIQLKDARIRAETRLKQPDMDPEVLRSRAEKAAQWEKEHGEVFAFCGKRS